MDYQHEKPISTAHGEQNVSGSDDADRQVTLETSYESRNLKGLRRSERIRQRRA